MPTGALLLEHAISEQPGMEDPAKWVGTFVEGIPTEYVPAEEPVGT